MDFIKSIELIFRFFRVQKGNRHLSFAENFALSGVAAIFSKTVAAPFDRVKLLVQCQGEMLKQGTIMRPYNGIIDCIVQIFRNEGLLSFYRGNLPACLRYFPTQVRVFF